MEIKPLHINQLPQIVDCLLLAFEGYFVKMPSSVEFWESKFKQARTNYSLSFGAFDECELVGFIMQGVDHHEGKLTTFNTGTGIIPSHRGKHLVDLIYDHALPILRNSGIEKCLLEVITENHRAIKVYERIGFKKKRTLRCFKTTLTENESSVRVSPSPFQHLKSPTPSEMMAWDYQYQALAQFPDRFAYYLVHKNDAQIGYFILDEEGGSLIDLVSYKEDYLSIINGIATITTSIKIINIDQRRSNLIQTLENEGWTNTIDQYEMEYLL